MLFDEDSCDDHLTSPQGEGSFCVRVLGEGLWGGSISGTQKERMVQGNLLSPLPNVLVLPGCKHKQRQYRQAKARLKIRA